MPGRNPRDALQAFVEPLRQDVSCISRSVLVVSAGGRSPGGVRSLTLNNGPMALNDRFTLDIGLQYDIIKVEESGDRQYKVRTRAYDYAIRDGDHRTQFSYHWHPLGESGYREPHFHNPPAWPGIHFPCARVSLESVIRFCVTELGAYPLRDDWETVLTLNEGLFQLYRTWNSQVTLAEPIRDKTARGGR